MKILNSSTNQLTEIADKKVTIYNCGPTVYNFVHIGNVRPLIVFDVLHRFLLASGKEVYYIQNITDVDDKIINAAKQEHVTEKELTDRFTKAYLDLFKLLNIKKLFMPKVSEHIEEIIDYIKRLIEKDAAYVVDGEVYFDISKDPGYGKISHQNVNALLDGVRKENKINKRSPLDFVLWKKTTEGINWSSPWVTGRPGWHTECCVLIDKYAHGKVTIHGGGVDLKFPHHENENAQSQAMYGHDIADVWMHVGHVNINGAKMSKSLGNYIFVKDVVNETNANGLRWFFYKSKYEQPVNFTKDLIDEANKEINNIIKNLSIAKTYIIANNAFSRNDNTSLSQEFISALSDDLNIPNGITEIAAQFKSLNILVHSKDFHKANVQYNILANELDVLGITTNQFDHESNIDLIKKWKASLDKKDFKTSDELRVQLVNKGLL